MLVTLLSPFTPMIFMGEEWGARTPWPFFSSHPEPELADLVRQGRVAEFARMEWNVATVPDPQDEATFRSAQLDWTEPQQPEHAALLGLSRRLIEIRRTYPAFTDPRFAEGWTRSDDAGGWLLIGRGDTVTAVNFSHSPAEIADVGAVNSILEIGEVTHREPTVVLGAHSALVGVRR